MRMRLTVSLRSPGACVSGLCACQHISSSGYDTARHDEAWHGMAQENFLFAVRWMHAIATSWAWLVAAPGAPEPELCIAAACSITPHMLTVNTLLQKEAKEAPTGYKLPILCKAERPNARSQVLVVLRAAPSATLTIPATEVGLPRRFTPAPHGDAGPRLGADHGEPAPIPPSSGLDFIDLVGLDDSTVWNCLQDALTYRVLVGKCPAKEFSRSAAHTDSFNVKQLKLYRDNVTRNLAPTVARGFANAARAAGHTISTTCTATAVANGAPQPPHLKAATAPQQPLLPLRQQTKSGALAGPLLSGADSSRPIEARYCQVQASKPTTTAAGSTAMAIATASGYGQAQRVVLAASVTVGHHGQGCGPKAAANSETVQPQNLQQTLQAPARNEAEASGRFAQGVRILRREAVVPAAAVPAEIPQMLQSAAMATASSGLPFLEKGEPGAVMPGRRRGSRGAGRGPLLAAAGRRGNGSAVCTEPAWI
ncbi:hypothetical protein VOLCADRAFT_106527 [Volvox carteri f. nagariensis]|uniref:Uncharacterized protein n=1 Tax=Volvox carteri f. nagariensis TaxID=3068 RepID=D8U7T9_VOLCA|nr:uncharacterized protein VOLCADRAFT_106527 [Volvox carteri f. nagariensis]EFJ44152.1 hypothetical protein VOLCADRAFT_106527 [Volvox carteri f. nagariensis]|eukprot:XP_002954746.1 hypothetical protein VOLCADRAFT_106527 [Volvox carteri f. nagariensis]